MTRTRRALTVLASLALLVAACGDDEDDETATTDAPAAAEGTTTAPEGEVAGAGGAIVEVASSDLGEMLVSEDRTLYVFTPDNGGPSTCYDQCAQTWPPLLATDDVTAGEGLDQSMLGTAQRDGGGEQVTVNGWPLYFFANDTGPGDTNGQGVGGNWWVVSPDGEPIEGT